MRSRTVCIAATVAVLLVGVVLSACGGGHAGSTGSSSGSAPADHNADDVTFARKMIPHHAQAIEMAQTAPSNTNNQPLVTLAYTIIETQTGEIQALREKLSRWSEDQSTGHDDHGGSDNGMVDQATIDKLATLKGEEFDRLWLSSMITHHRGAIEMAQAEVAHGQDADVKYLATRIIDAQRSEIEQMNQMLGG